MDRLQGYENVDHVLRVLCDMHQCLNKVFSELEGRAQADRSKLALGYLAQYHARQSDSLAIYRRNATPLLLRQWFQIPFPEEPGDLIAALRAKPADDPPLDEVVAEIDAFTDRLLRHLRDRAETKNVKHLFQGLLDIEDRERHLRSRALGSFAQT